ncbi:MAG: hypothetical protein M1838_003428 [Thelocarpon superellum]|nr:MAG: hypothetical protein M1838_003428 [Thelocarpon superellum]
MATAAVADSKYKQGRRERLDRAIEDARMDVESGRQRHERDQSSQSHTGRVAPDPLPRSAISETLRRGMNVLESAPRVIDPVSIDDLTLPDGISPACHAWAMRVARGEAVVSNASPRTPTEWEIASRQRLMAKLVAQLLRASEQGTSPSGVVRESPLELVEMRQRLRTIMQPGLASTAPAYPSYGRWEESRVLNRALRKLVSNVGPGPDPAIRGSTQAALTMARICYQLLVSSSPPNTNTYNLLIIYLSRTRENHMVDLVLDSFFESRLVLNDVTTAAMLKHFTATNNVAAFHLLSGLVTGVKRRRETGTSVQIRPTSSALIQPGHRDVPLKSGTDAILVKRNPVVFGALMAAALKFDGLARAMDLYQQLLRAGWQANMQVWTSILRACRASGDWTTGQMIWQQMDAKATGSEGADNGECKDGRAFLWMLKLCEATQQWPAFQSIYQEAVASGFVERAVAALDPWQARHCIRQGERALVLDDRSKTHCVFRSRKDLTTSLRALEQQMVPLICALVTPMSIRLTWVSNKDQPWSVRLERVALLLTWEQRRTVELLTKPTDQLRLWMPMVCHERQNGDRLRRHISPSLPSKSTVASSLEQAHVVPAMVDPAVVVDEERMHEHPRQLAAPKARIVPFATMTPTVPIRPLYA